MRVQICSDIHNEFGIVSSNYDKMIKTPADILVLAGDIASHSTIIPLLKDIQKESGKTIIFVPGNHEYYGTTRKELDKKLRAANTSNIIILIERDIIIENVVFIGATGWWDGSGGNLNQNVIYGLNDFRMIYDLMENGEGIWWGQQSRSYIDGRLYYYRSNLPHLKRVVVTHHFPHRRSVAKAFRGSQLNVCFYNSWEDMINEYRPEYWIHGHTHVGFDYIVKENDGFPHLPIKDERTTRIICNPQGYPEKFALPKDDIDEYYRKGDLVANESDFNIYLTTENIHYDPSFVIEI